MISKIYKKIKCKSGKTDVGYLDNFYDDYFKNKEYQNILEIGCKQGESLRLWESFFPIAKISGIDIRDFPKPQKATKIIGNAYSKKFVLTLKDNTFDLIIDDGPHTYESFIFLLEHYYPKLKTAGELIIEDIFRPNIPGKPNNVGVTEEQQKHMINFALQLGYNDVYMHDIISIAKKNYETIGRPLFKDYNRFINGLFIMTAKKG